MDNQLNRNMDQEMEAYICNGLQGLGARQAKTP